MATKVDQTIALVFFLDEAGANDLNRRRIDYVEKLIDESILITRYDYLILVYCRHFIGLPA